MPVQIGLPITLEKLEEAHVRKVLAQTSSLLDAAAILGIDQATLYRKRKKLGLE
jgi:NtrC-family two-component system response regulator AlgB